MRWRLAGALWLAAGIALWNGFFDLYISRGAREYLHRHAEYELGREPEPAMSEVMGRARRTGLVVSSLWAVGVVGAGWATLWMAVRQNRASRPPHRRRDDTMRDDE